MTSGIKKHSGLVSCTYLTFFFFFFFSCFVFVPTKIDRQTDILQSLLTVIHLLYEQCDITLIGFEYWQSNPSHEGHPEGTTQVINFAVVGDLTHGGG